MVRFLVLKTQSLYMLCIYTYIHSSSAVHAQTETETRETDKADSVSVCVCVCVQPAVQKSAFKPCQNIADPVS